MRHPPSPALSACDSLDGDDLDAFLASQGSLSHFPTPPPKQDVVVEAIEVLEELAQCEVASRDCRFMPMSRNEAPFHLADSVQMIVPPSSWRSKPASKLVPLPARLSRFEESSHERTSRWTSQLLLTTSWLASEHITTPSGV